MVCSHTRVNLCVALTHVRLRDVLEYQRPPVNAVLGVPRSLGPAAAASWSLSATEAVAC